MLKAAQSRAEKQFIATQRENKRALNEKEKMQLERTELTVSLRALRLAKEAADKQVAENVAIEKAAAKSKKSRRLSSPLPD